MGDEAEVIEGKANPKTLLAQGILAASGAYGLSISQPLFAGPAYGLSLLSGFVGLTANLTGNDTILKFSKYTSGLGRCFIVPLIAAEVCCANGIQLELSALNLLYPAIHYIGKYLLKKDDLANQAYLDASQAISICAIAYFSFVNENWWGIGTALIYAMSCLGQNVVEDPQGLVIFMAVGTFMYILEVY